MSLTHMLDAALSLRRRGMPSYRSNPHDASAMGHTNRTAKSAPAKRQSVDSSATATTTPPVTLMSSAAGGAPTCSTTSASGPRPATSSRRRPRHGGRLDELGGIPPTRIAATGGGGWHAWFRWNGPTPRDARRYRRHRHQNPHRLPGGTAVDPSQRQPLRVVERGTGRATTRAPCRACLTTSTYPSEAEHPAQPDVLSVGSTR